jgi:hypothetical protein
LPALQVHYIETLHALAGRVAGTEVPAEEEARVHRRLQAHLPPPEDPPPASRSSFGGGARGRQHGGGYTVAHYFAAMYVQAAIKGFLQRHQIQRQARTSVIDGGNGEPELERSHAQ